MSSGVPYDELDKEFERIGADQTLRRGLASTDPRVTLDLILAALRATPSGSGTQGFEETLRRMLEVPGQGRAGPPIYGAPNERMQLACAVIQRNVG